MNQEKVFCLFQTGEDLESFYLSELAQSDIYRCLLIFKDKRKRNLKFYRSLEERYTIKYYELSSMERKSQNVDFLEPQLADIKCFPHNLHSFVNIYIDFSLINLTPSKINTIVDTIEEQLSNNSNQYTLYSIFNERNIKKQDVQQIVLNYPFLSLSPSQISPNFYYDENAIQKTFPSNLRDIYLPINILCSCSLADYAPQFASPINRIKHYGLFEIVSSSPDVHGKNFIISCEILCCEFLHRVIG